MFFEGFGRVWRLIMLTRSTITRLGGREDAQDLPWRPRSLPAITTTVSSFLSFVFVLVFITALPERAK